MKDLSSSPNPELIVPSSPTSPIIDPRLSPNGLFLAYVRDSELHVLNLLKNQTQQLTTGANGSTLVSKAFCYITVLVVLLTYHREINCHLFCCCRLTVLLST